jgi:hypothetical protein
MAQAIALRALRRSNSQHTTDFMDRISLLQWLNQRPWLNLAFLFLAFISIVLTIALFLRSKKDKKPRFSKRKFRLIPDNLQDLRALEIRYEGKMVPNLAVTRFALWNHGTEPIERANVAPKNPLRIRMNHDQQLLGASIVRRTTDENSFQIEADLKSSEVLIEFDYFAKNEGVVIDVYHTGAQESGASLHGTIKGVDAIIQIDPDTDYLIDTVLGRFFDWIPSPSKMPKVIKVGYALLIVIVLIILLPVLIPLFLVDQVIKLFRRTPTRLAIDRGREWRLD